MIRPDGYVKLMDFGLARVQAALGAESTRAGTDPGMIIGTVGYMAPEQARGEAAAPEADVFAFGVMLYEMVTGRHPFMAGSQLATLHALMWETPEPPSLLNPELPRALDQLILEMLHKDAKLRPGAGEVLYRLGLAHDASVAVALSAVTTTTSRVRSSRSVVGRDLEMDALLHEFERAQKGKGRLVVVSAEAGMGKTTLVEAFVKLLEERGEAVRVGRGRCSERLAGNEAYLPVLEVLDSLQHNEQLGSLTRVIRALAPTWYAQIIPTSANDSSARRLAAETLGGSQERLKREITALLEDVARMHPVVLCFDDVHWADPSTTDLIGYLARRIESVRVLLVELGNFEQGLPEIERGLETHTLTRSALLRPYYVTLYAGARLRVRAPAAARRSADGEGAGRRRRGRLRRGPGDREEPGRPLARAARRPWLRSLLLTIEINSQLRNFQLPKNSQLPTPKAIDFQLARLQFWDLQSWEFFGSWKLRSWELIPVTRGRMQGRKEKADASARL
jgi:AAA ATPase domain/Protein kinase domain